MSNKNVDSVCIVVDASIARSSGPPESLHPLGARCREFLMRLRGVGHRIAFNKAIRAEWQKHQSKFARDWYVSMFRMNKIRPVSDDQNDELRNAIASCSADAGVVAVMVKDAHLVEAALASDHRISALDETARKHFCHLSTKCNLVQLVVWVNPAIEDESVLDWLQRGAPDEAARRLKAE